MKIKISIPYIVAFLLLVIVLLEMHEMTHILVGYALCGCFGIRDFNVWALCEGCAQSHSFYWLATFMGPLFSFSMMWLGMFWLSSANIKKKTFGFSLIFANIPFGRISEVMKGAGDEMVVIRHLLKNDFSRTQMILIGSTIVLLLGLPPIIKAYRSLTNNRSWLYMIGFLTLPLVFILLYILTGMNTLLSTGLFSTPWIMGTPLLITLHTIIALGLLLVCQKGLFSLTQTDSQFSIFT